MAKRIKINIGPSTRAKLSPGTVIDKEFLINRSIPVFCTSDNVLKVDGLPIQWTYRFGDFEIYEIITKGGNTYYSDKPSYGGNIRYVIAIEEIDKYKV